MINIYDNNLFHFSLHMLINYINDELQFMNNDKFFFFLNSHVISDNMIILKYFFGIT